ncbi:hypothetical protein AAG570_001241 [Ranatra chinensis]|uniref:Uncharacterized protein n=1 Tax=Ranatra chinensis TaxID=642074 RepID=A0ABD0YMZ9_9HEMI
MLLAGFWIVSSVLASRILVDATFLIGSSTDGRTLFTSPFSRIVEEAIEYGRRRMIQHGPFFLGSSEQEVLGDTNRYELHMYLSARLNVKLSNVTLSKAGDFKVVSVENSVLAMWTKIRVNYPNLHVDGNFQIDGAIRGADVNGQGKFR